MGIAEWILVGTILGLAVFGIARHLYRAFAKPIKKAGPGCSGCSGCALPSDEKDKTI